MKTSFQCERTCSRWQECRFSEIFLSLGNAYVHSHVTEFDLKFKDLDALEAAAKECGLEMRRGQATYRWYGKYMGDYKLQSGMKVEDLGKCSHALGIPGSPQAYEVGVCRTGKNEYKLRWDFWNGGYGLQEKIGENGQKLTDAYKVEVVKKTCKRLGWTVQRQGSKLIVYHPSGGTMTISTDGKIEANGFVGKACTEATAPILKALGVKLTQTLKPEAAQVLQQVKLG